MDILQFLLDAFNTYWEYWIYYTFATWFFYFIGFAILNRLPEDFQNRPPTKLMLFLIVTYETVLDMPCNWFLSFIPFFQLPHSRGELVTERLRAYKQLADNHHPVRRIENLKDMGIYADKSTLSFMDKIRYDIAVSLCGALNKNRQKNRHC